MLQSSKGVKNKQNKHALQAKQIKYAFITSEIKHSLQSTQIEKIRGFHIDKTFIKVNHNINIQLSLAQRKLTSHPGPVEVRISEFFEVFCFLFFSYHLITLFHT